MKIKELVLKYKNIVFICNSSNDFVEFVNQATSEIFFSKTFYKLYKYHESKDEILRGHIHTGKSFALICTQDLTKYGYDGEIEFQFYSREYSDFDLYNNWSEYKFINFTKYLRKEKLKKLNEKFSYR